MTIERSDKAFYSVLTELTALRRDQLPDSASLTLDLGIAGADGWELIDELNKAYEIDWAEFDPYGHFGPEVAFNPVSYLWHVISGQSAQDSVTGKRLTVRHLRNVCLVGKWFEPET